MKIQANSSETRVSNNRLEFEYNEVVDMNTEQRFERIETTLLALAEAQVRTQTAVAVLTEGVGGLVQTVSSLTETVTGLAETVTGFASSTDTRMKRIEENLDALIRALTAEHSNGRQK